MRLRYVLVSSQRVQLDGAVVVVADGCRARRHLAHLLLRAAASAAHAVGNQQVHEEAAQAQRHPQQRAARLPLASAVRPRPGESRPVTPRSRHVACNCSSVCGFRYKHGNCDPNSRLFQRKRSVVEYRFISHT